MAGDRASGGIGAYLDRRMSRAEAEQAGGGRRKLTSDQRARIARAMAEEDRKDTSMSGQWRRAARQMVGATRSIPEYEDEVPSHLRGAIGG